MSDWITDDAISFATTLGALITGVALWVAYEWLSEGYDRWQSIVRDEQESTYEDRHHEGQ